jgi:3-deoxy-manno-octulosonate cytidylyltransferase (CMP-KDO synthetase)
LFVNHVMKVTCLIPARYGSSRLPGKPLLKINGISIIARVYQQVQKCRLINDIIVLTDDVRIQQEIETINGRCELVTEPCLNGSERIVRYLKSTGDSEITDIIVNVQGDEPYIEPEYIDKCIENYIRITECDSSVKCSTLHFRMERGFESRSTGKLVLDRLNNIMYCSRNVIPGAKGQMINPNATYFGHIGIFVFNPDYLTREYLSGNTPYQLSEDIEWLKILEDGYRINSVLVEHPEISVDTQEDYAFLVKKYETFILE